MTSAASAAASSLSVTMLPWVRRSFPVSSSLVFHASSNYPPHCRPSPVVRGGGRVRHLSKKTKSHPNNNNNNNNANNSSNSNTNKEESSSSQTPESLQAATALNNATTTDKNNKSPSESTFLFTTTSVPPPLVSTKSNPSSSSSSNNNNDNSSRSENSERPKSLRREKTTVPSGLYKQQPQPPAPPPQQQPPTKNTTTSHSRTSTTSMGTSPPVTLLFQQRQVYPPPPAARRSELPILHASALLDPKMHCQMDSITGVTSRSGTDAARRLAEGRKTLLETMRYEWLQRQQQRPGSSSSQNPSPPPSSYASRRRSSRPHVLTGHGAPKSLLQHHIDYTDLFLQQLNGVACSFRNFEDRDSHHGRTATSSSSSSRSQQHHQQQQPHPQQPLQHTSWVIHHERQFDSMQVVGVDGQSRHCSWPLPLTGEEGTKGMGLYLAVMNRIAEHLSVVFPKATTTTTTSTPLTTTTTTTLTSDKSYEDIGTPPEFSSSAEAAAVNDNISDEEEEDDDFVVANTSSFRDRTRASWWKVEMSRGSKYASHVLPESYRLEGDPVLVVTCEPQFRVVSLQLQGIPTNQRNHPSHNNTHNHHYQQQQNHFYNHQHNFGVSEPLTLEFHARFPLPTQAPPSSTPL